MSKRRIAPRRFGILPGDIVILAVLLAVSASLGIFFTSNRPKPEYVSVRVDGMEITRLPLNKDRVYKVSEGNTIEIAGRSVRMTEATCRDRICVKTGSISRCGQSIVCAPHKLVVTIVGKSKPDSYDAITN